MNRHMDEQLDGCADRLMCRQMDEQTDE